jgi:filamentous hemagglutinin family protein
MNHVYRLTWNESLQQYVPAPETARGRCKGGKTKRKLIAAAVAAVLVGGSPGAFSLPVGGQVSSGTGSVAVTPGGTTLTVSQSSQNLALNWQSFNIAGNETVNFIQPNASAIALNRVLGSDPSAIYGKLNANGQVFLLNPNGILFGAGAEVNVGGLVASALNLSDADFMSGKRTFTGGSSTADSAAVTNLGNIAANGGYIAFLGGKVSNQGTLQANLGTVALAAGNQTTLDFAGDKLIKLQVDQGALNALAANGQLIQADGGTVILTAKAANSLVSAVVNNTGLIQAQTLTNHAGVISLLGDMQSGVVNIGGTLDASAPNSGNGGFIDTSAAQVNVANNAKITTAASMGLAGTWLIDPSDFTIAASGGDITGATLSTELGGGNVTILSTSGASGTSGNVNINDVVTWSANQLTLNAQNNININANLDGSGTASLALQYGQKTRAAGNTSTYSLNDGAQVNLPAGLNFSTKLGSNGSKVIYTVITDLGAAGSTTATDLQGMNGNLAGNYALGANIDATATSSWNGGAGFTPIGGATGTSAIPTNQFTGTFDGLGHTISNLSINLPASYYVGLFGYAGTGSVIRNVGLVGGSVTGSNYVGGLVGANYGVISNSYATGNVSGNSYSGGLVGANSGTINNSYATGSVSGGSYNYAGGLAGANFGMISNSYATGSVSGGNYVGGLVGSNSGTSGTISKSYATGSVNGNSYVGGLAGANYGTISNSYSTGSVSGGSYNYVGGLAGANYGAISNSYATGSVSGNNNVGGLVGANPGLLSNSYATGSVSGNNYVGGLAGLNSGMIGNSYAAGSISGSSAIGGLVGSNSGNSGMTSHSFWDIATSGLSSSAGGTGLTTAQMMQLSSFMGWSITATGNGVDTWRIYQGNTMPLLTSFLTPLTLGDAPDASVTYQGHSAAQNGGTTAVTAPGLLGAAATGTNAGFYNGYYSTQQGYDIIGGNLTITPKSITVTATGGTMGYNDSTTDTALTLASAGVISGDSVTFTDTSATFANKNAGTGKTVTVSGIKASGADAGNYIIVDAKTTTTASITPKAITVTATSGNMVYDDSTTDKAVKLGSSGVYKGDAVIFTDTSATFAGKDAGTEAVNVLGISASGASAGNYTLLNTTATTTASITPKAITVTATSGSMVYDGSTTDTAPIKLASSGVIKNDTVTFADSSALFSNKNAGSESLTVSGISATGADAGNYTFNSTATTKAIITPKPITVTASSGNMAYSGLTADTAPITLSSTGVISGDVVNFTDTSATFSSKTIGNGKTVTVKGITESGANANDYKLISKTTTTTANITTP